MNRWMISVLPLVFGVVEVKSGIDGFMIKMRDGRHMRCVHNNPQGGHLPDYAPHPAIVLKMEDGTGLLLPIIVCMLILNDYSLILRILYFGIYIRNLCNFMSIWSWVYLWLQWRCPVCCSWQQCAMFQLYGCSPYRTSILIKILFLFLFFFLGLLSWQN